jgi:2-methylcitrate dehydratase PrpD
LGVFGSVAALAKLRGFDAERTRRAFGIAASQSGELRENFGTMSKPFQAGHAAEAGVVAADLAALGWTASEQILEAPSGFFHAAGGSFAPAAIAGKLGKPWTFHDPGVSIKPFPSGSLTHPGMTELLRLIHEHEIRPQDVEQVDVPPGGIAVPYPEGSCPRDRTSTATSACRCRWISRSPTRCPRHCGTARARAAASWRLSERAG